MVSRTKVSADDMASPMERRYQHLRRPLVLAVLAVSVIALGIGLGLGLGLKRMPALPATEGQPPASIWQPQVGGSWQIVLESAIRFDDYQKPSVIPDVEIFDIDLYDNEDSCFDALHKLGKKAICYFNAGAYESWRPDSDQFLREDLGKELDGWPGELWLDLRSESVRKIMAERIRLASMKACDAVDPDNVDGYQNDNGLNLTAKDSVDFVMFLANEARKYNLAIGLKNAGDIVSDVLHLVQFAVNEQCVQFSECHKWAPFIKAGKPVFHIEYVNETGAAPVREGLCSNRGPGAGSDGFSTVIKNLRLDGFVGFCNGTNLTTPTE